MILIRTTIKANWKDGSGGEHSYAFVQTWDEVHDKQRAAQELALKRTRALHEHGATGQYYVEAKPYDDSQWPTLSLEDLPGIPLPMLRRVLEYVPIYEEAS